MRSFDGSSPNLLGVCRWTFHLPLRDSFPKRSTGRRVNGLLSLSTILYMRQPHATQPQKSPFALLLQSLIRHLLLHCISTGNCLVLEISLLIYRNPYNAKFLKIHQENGVSGTLTVTVA